MGPCFQPRDAGARCPLHGANLHNSKAHAIRSSPVRFRMRTLENGGKPSCQATVYQNKETATAQTSRDRFLFPSIRGGSRLTDPAKGRSEILGAFYGARKRHDYSPSTPIA